MAKQRRPFGRDDKRFWSSIALTFGLACFFFGVLVVRDDVPMNVGWLTFGVGIVLLIIGFATAYRSETD